MTGRDIPQSLREYMARLGKRGGEAKGKSKRRGDKAFYRELALKSAAAKARKRRAQDA